MSEKNEETTDEMPVTRAKVSESDFTIANKKTGNFPLNILSIFFIDQIGAFYSQESWRN